VDRPWVRSPRPGSWRLTCPSVRASSSSSPAGLTWPRQRPFEPAHEDPYPAGYPRRPVGGLVLLSWFPVAFRPPAFASRSSDSRRGVRPSSRSAYRPRRPDPDGVTAFRTHELRPGWVPSIPRGRRCSSRSGRPDRPASAAFSAARPCVPLQRPIHRECALRGINEGSSNSPVRASPRLPPPGWNGPRLGLFPELRTPPTRRRTTHVRVGTGHRART
jgi:hypothetical protein